MKAKLSKVDNGWALTVDNIIYATTENSPYKRLSLKNCQAIERGYDLDELVEEEVKLHHTLSPKAFKRGIQIGFQKAVELMGDKKFSEDDLRNAMNWIMAQYFEFNEQPTTRRREHYIQSLKQTEWEVEIEMEFNPINHASGLKITGNELMDVVILENYKPKLDADGCLILKVKSE